MYRNDPKADPPVLVLGFGGKVVGMDPRTGNEFWSQELSTSAVELWIDDSFILAASQGKLTCLEYPTGRPLWTAEFSKTGRPTMVIEGGAIFIGVRGEVFCFNRGGKQLWHQPFRGKGRGEVALGFPHNVRQSDQIGA